MSMLITWRGDTLCDEMLRRGDEIIKAVLLLVKGASLVPVLAVLATTAQAAAADTGKQDISF